MGTDPSFGFFQFNCSLYTFSSSVVRRIGHRLWSAVLGYLSEKKVKTDEPLKRQWSWFPEGPK